jgi:hypothetical protein
MENATLYYTKKSLFLQEKDVRNLQRKIGNFMTKTTKALTKKKTCAILFASKNNLMRNEWNK